MTPPKPVGWAVPTMTLDHLQRWLLSAITSPSETAPSDLDSTILPSRNQSATDRLAIYQNAYLARLLEVLRELYPCTRFAVGDELFDQFAAGYLAAHPPHSYTLALLADQWVEYLNTSRPADWGRFIVELARLEHTIDRIFDAPGPENLPPFALPNGAAASLKLSFVPGFELLAFDFPASSFYTAWKAGEHPSWPNERQEFVALLRRDYIVRRYELTKTQYELLVALHRGDSLDNALSAASNSIGVNADDLAAKIGPWFQLWAAEQFFSHANEPSFNP
jgi:hypothetical protein